jgi:mono/diheme cytochrome c family protein
VQSLILSQRLLGAFAVAAALGVVTPFPPSSGARGDDTPARTATPQAASRPVSYLREVRPILAQHCFQCHGPDEAARKGKLRLDLKEHAFAERKGAHVIAPRDPDGSLVWERITSTDKRRQMPP